MKILSETTLNSIMFLLIPLAYSCNYHCRNALNSIMFLLIPQKWRIYEQSNANFKFHYVSINSKGIRRMKTTANYFKFHYVSINSFRLVNFFCYLCFPLNSIMFLLILETVFLHFIINFFL